MAGAGAACAGSGAGAATSSAGTVLGGFGLFLEPGGRPRLLGAGGSGAGAGGSAACGAWVPEPAPQHLAQALEERRPPHQPFNWNKDFIVHSRERRRMKRWYHECLRRCHPHPSI